MKRKPSLPAAASRFNAQAFLDSAGLAKTVVKFEQGDAIFTQGDLCEHVMYIRKGAVKLSVLSKTGKEAVVAMLSPGDFFAEGCLAGQRLRMRTATAVAPSAILRVGKAEMVRVLHKQHAMSDRFIAHMLARNIRIEEDLIDQLFNSVEKRLARAPSSRRARGKGTAAVLPFACSAFVRGRRRPRTSQFRGNVGRSRDAYC